MSTNPTSNGHGDSDGDGDGGGSRRRCVDVSPAVYVSLQGLAGLQGVGVAEVVEQAVSLYSDRWSRDIEPEHARLASTHWRCRLRRHRIVSWSYEIEPLHPGTRTRLVTAECVCGRPQQRVRVVYRPWRTMKVTAPTAKSEGTSAADGGAGVVTSYVRRVLIG